MLKRRKRERIFGGNFRPNKAAFGRAASQNAKSVPEMTPGRCRIRSCYQETIRFHNSTNAAQKLRRSTGSMGVMGWE